MIIYIYVYTLYRYFFCIFRAWCQHPFFWTRLTKTEHAFDAGDLGELPKLVIKHSQFWWDLNRDLNGDLMKSGGIVLMVLWDLMG